MRYFGFYAAKLADRGTQKLSRDLAPPRTVGDRESVIGNKPGEVIRRFRHGYHRHRRLGIGWPFWRVLILATIAIALVNVVGPILRELGLLDTLRQLIVSLTLIGLTVPYAYYLELKRRRSLNRDPIPLRVFASVLGEPLALLLLLAVLPQILFLLVRL
jgi:hypothetical protein